MDNDSIRAMPPKTMLKASPHANIHTKREIGCGKLDRPNNRASIYPGRYTWSVTAINKAKNVPCTIGICNKQINKDRLMSVILENFCLDTVMLIYSVSVEKNL